MAIRTLFCCFLLGLFSWSSVASAGLYRWVDDDGNVHYTDRLPPERAPDGRQVFGRDGVMREDVPRAPTEEERAAMEQERQERQERLELEEQRLQEQAAYDRFLLHTYTNEREILEARDQHLERIRTNREMLEHNKREDERRLREARQQAVDAERSDSSDLDAVYDRIEELESRIEIRRNDIAELSESETSLQEEFRRHRQRFQELQE